MTFILNTIFNFVFIKFIRFYQIFLSPIFGGQCRFHPSCSSYALLCFEHLPVYKAFYKSIHRVFRCNPYNEGGFDHPLYSTIEEYEKAVAEENSKLNNNVNTGQDKN